MISTNWEFRLRAGIRDQDGVVAVLKEYFGSWTPASTTICINQLSMPGARIELDMIAAFPPGK